MSRRRIPGKPTPDQSPPSRRLTAPRLSDYVASGEFQRLPDAQEAAQARYDAEFDSWYREWLGAYEDVDVEGVDYETAQAAAASPEVDPGVQLLDWAMGVSVGNRPTIVVDIPF